jgi:hypothetical protein
VTLALMIAELALLARRRRSLLASKRPRGMRSAEAG